MRIRRSFWVVAAVCLQIALVRQSFARDDAAPATTAAPANTATTPLQHKGKQWEDRDAKINERAKQGDVDLLFIGDSITQGWDGKGKAVWQKYYGNRKALNAGVSGDRTEHVLWRLDHGDVDGIHPKLAVIMIGTNNVNSNTAEEIAEGVKAIVSEVREKLPETKILLLAILPRGAVTEAQLEKAATQNGKKQVDPADMPAKVEAARKLTAMQREKITVANDIISKLADNKTVFYMDIGSKFLGTDGVLPDDIMPDFLHPNDKGYEIWAEAIEPKVAELMGEKK